MYDVGTLEARIANALGQPRFLAQVLSLFAVPAIVLATIGTYGVIPPRSRSAREGWVCASRGRNAQWRDTSRVGAGTRADGDG